jgi:hypothetical protein
LNGTGVLELVNYTSQSQKVEFSFVLQQESGCASECRVETPLLPHGGTTVEAGKHHFRLELPPGRNRVLLQAVSGTKRQNQRLILDQIQLQPWDSAAVAGQ